MYEALLEQLNLNSSEISVFNALLNNGQMTARQIALKTELNRTNVYNILGNLEKLGLAEQITDQAKINYRLTHPYNLKDLLERKKDQIQQTETSLSAAMPQLISQYNLSVGKPGVRFYEGKDGLKQIMDDSLKAESEILSYVDVEAVEKFIKKENQAYVKKREKLGLKKKILVTNSAYNKEYFRKLGPQVTDVRFISFNMSSFNTVMQIYDNKITYLTLQPASMIGLIIEDPLINKMHAGLFKYNWSTALKTY